MGDFHRCIQHILAEEGGLSNHPNDPGGLTKFGISKAAFPHIDIAKLTEAQAMEIYRRHYWDEIRGDALPAGLDLLVFDGAVNQGTLTAKRLLQETLRVTADGAIGPVTLAAAKRAMPVLLNNFAAERALRYEFSNNEIVFGRGWYRRLFRLHPFARHYATEANE